MVFVVAVDQGTTGTKSYRLHHPSAQLESALSLEHPQIFDPEHPGRVEHDPERILADITACLNHAVGTPTSDPPSDQCVGIGLDNQGETCVAFDRQTGLALGNAIVWQDNRTDSVVQELKAQGHEQKVKRLAGLPLDCYFSATKLAWLLGQPLVAACHQQGTLGLCTLDAFCLFRLTGEYVTDVSTASRTSLMNLDTLQWDSELCALFSVPLDTLPSIVPTTGGFFGKWTAASGLSVPVVASVVDQTGALFGHGCRGADGSSLKVTFGTGEN